MLSKIGSREAGERAGQEWMRGLQGLNPAVISGLEELGFEGEVVDSAATVFDKLYPDGDRAAAATFWERVSGTGNPRPAFVQGFIAGALEALAEVKLRAKWL